MAIETRQGTLYDQLRASILNGELHPGMALVEATVAETYGVSRTPVREALQALERDGILQRSGRRLIIRVTTLDEVIQVYDLRIVLEGVAAGWAALRRSEGDLILLEHALNEMAEAGASSPLELSGMNHNFHDRLWRTSHNAPVVEMLTRLHEQILRFPERTVSQPGRWESSIAEHALILKAVREQDEDAAIARAREHMIAARDLRLRLIHTPTA